jgi:type I restriction enzyme S subunit
MTNLEKLLDGVEVKYLPLGKITTYEQPSDYLVKSTNYKDKFPTPVLTAGKTFILGYTDEKTGIYKASINPVIIFDDFTTANKWVDFDFKAKSSAMKMITSKDETKILLRYIYHWLKTLPSNLVEGDHKRQWISNFSNKKIPIPCPDNQKKSIEIQRKIVDVLDKFTTLETELEAELNYRKRQYEYYRNKLLSFDALNSEWQTLSSVKWMSISDVCTNICSGGTPLTSKQEFYQGNIPWLRTQNVNWKEVYDTDIKISEEAIERSSAKIIPSNCVIIAMYGATAAKACINKIPLATNQACCNLQVNEQIANYKYVYYWLCHEYNKLKALAEGSQSNINEKKIKAYKIPVPSIEEQQRIVSILDKFNLLTTSISEGLPKEIELRRKQYEYYRNKLLSFPNAKITQ